MKRIILMMMFAAALLAQEETTSVVTMQYVTPESVASSLYVVANNKARFSASNQTRTVTLTGPAALVGAMEAMLKKLDVPAAAQKNVEATFYMILAGPLGDSGSIPSDLTGVVQQLRGVFGLKSFRVLETAVVRGREGKRLETSGLIAPVSKVEANAYYTIGVSNVAINATEKGSTIRLDGLRFNTRLPTGLNNQIQYADAGIQTEIDVREGQKVVVGKSSIDTASQSIFLVVTAKVVD